jgi:hypothetical protein
MHPTHVYRLLELDLLSVMVINPTNYDMKDKDDVNVNDCLCILHANNQPKALIRACNNHKLQIQLRNHNPTVTHNAQRAIGLMY